MPISFAKPRNSSFHFNPAQIMIFPRNAVLLDDILDLFVLAFQGFHPNGQMMLRLSFLPAPI
jgi:hypothetical protein